MKIRIYNGIGVSNNSLEHAVLSLKLYASNNYFINYISPEEIIEGNWFSETRLLILPGGADLYYGKLLNNQGNKQIRKFLMHGGKFLGICAGSYYSGNYVEFAKNSKIEVVGRRELAIYQGMVRGPVLSNYYYNSNKGARAAKISLCQNIDGIVGDNCHVFYNGGGYFVDAENVVNTEIIATYDDTKAAIIKCSLGTGTAILTGVHLEYNPNIMVRGIYLNQIINLLKESNDKRVALLKYIFKILSVN